MDAKEYVIIAGHTTLISVQQTVAILLKPGTLLSQNIWNYKELDKDIVLPDWKIYELRIRGLLWTSQSM
jgi:hypothetical protein